MLLLPWLFLLVSFITAQEIPTALEDLVKARLNSTAYFSWEQGLRSLALLEQLNLSPFSPSPLPQIPLNDSTRDGLGEVYTLTQNIVSSLTVTDGGSIREGNPQPLFVNDGSAADPASIGIAVLLMNYTGLGGTSFGSAAKNQLDYLLYNAPRTGDGAISHRAFEVQLWSDFVYMVPPFIAYYGFVQQNSTLLQYAYDQIRLYRNYLRDPNTNLWKHVTLGDFEDQGFWSTGNGWMAQGTLMVLSLIIRSQFADEFRTQSADLNSWVLEVMDGMYSGSVFNSDAPLFPNYAQRPWEQGNFVDAASTALLAASAYRLSVLMNIHTYIPLAELSRQALAQTNPQNSSQFQHFTDDGYLFPIVDPRNFGNQGFPPPDGQGSPEGQGFVLMMQVAWRAWVNAGSPGKDGSVRLNGSASVMTASSMPRWSVLPWIALGLWRAF